MKGKKSLLIVDDDIAHRTIYTPKPRIFFAPANLYFEKKISMLIFIFHLELYQDVKFLCH